jgi:N6-adenosine-specific RNA methylase IME4
MELVRYDAMCRAIAECHAVDEVKDIRDKARALEHYARQAKDKEAVRQCGAVRLRAEVKAGELLAKMEKAKGAKGNPGGQGAIVVRSHDDTTQTLSSIGVSKKQSSDWQQLAALPTPEIEAALNKSVIPTTNALLKKPRRAKRERAFAETTKQTKLYGVIYADPPWRFEPYSRETGLDRAADSHYETMSLDDIVTMAVPAAPDCVLFLWATVPMLPEALAVMRAWGFTYKSHCAWVKDRMGTGHWFRNKHELLLVGTRGVGVPAPAPGEQYVSVIEAALGRHSEKPACFAEMIEEMFPHVPAIELFARGQRLGWDVWGNEAG